MATKQELEVQVAAMQAELDQLKAANPDAAAAAELDNVKAELASVLANAESAQDALTQQVADLNSALDLSNAQVAKLQQDNIAAGAQVSDLTAKLAVAQATLATAGESADNVVDSSRIIFRGTVRAAMEHFRKQFCAENDEAIILKER